MKKFNAFILVFFIAIIDYSISLYYQLRLINNNIKSVLVEEENISPFEFDMQFEIITSTIITDLIFVFAGSFLIYYPVSIFRKNTSYKNFVVVFSIILLISLYGKYTF